MATALQPVTRVLAAIGANLLQNTGHAEADIEPMAKAGVHIFGPMQDQRTYFNYHHAAADTLDKIDRHEWRKTRHQRLCLPMLCGHASAITSLRAIQVMEEQIRKASAFPGRFESTGFPRS